MSEKPVRDRPRRLADWLNPTGGKGGPLLGGSGNQAEVLWGIAVEECRPQPDPARLGLRSHSHWLRPVCPSGFAGACAPALPESFLAPVLLTRLCESWMRENRTSSLS